MMCKPKWNEFGMQLIHVLFWLVGATAARIWITMTSQQHDDDDDAVKGLAAHRTVPLLFMICCAATQNSICTNYTSITVVKQSESAIGLSFFWCELVLIEPGDWRTGIKYVRHVFRAREPETRRGISGISKHWRNIYALYEIYVFTYSNNGMWFGIAWQKPENTRTAFSDTFARDVVRTLERSGLFSGLKGGNALAVRKWHRHILNTNNLSWHRHHN